MKEYVKERIDRLKKRQIGLRNLISLSFTVASLLAVLLMGRAFYLFFSDQNQKQSGQDRALMLQQINSNITAYLQNMMDVSDVCYYRIIKDQDIQSNDFHDQLSLLYDSNRSYIKNIALFTEEGEALDVVPEAIVKDKVKPREQEWFQKSLQKSENQHFCAPHVQNLFEERQPGYEWVISLSRAVQITDNGQVRQGVLLIDLKYSGFEQLVGEVSIGEDGYIYIVDGEGNLIYHPIRQQSSSEAREFYGKVAKEKKVGTFIEKRPGQIDETIVKMVGYTGWYLVGGTLTKNMEIFGTKGNLLFAALFLLFATILVLLNSFISAMVTKPFQGLERTVEEIERGNLDVQINVSGVYEVQHLEQTLRKMSRQLKKLMEDMVQEHEAKRKTELDTLQAQINPHFLYNTLDVIIWMISNEQKQEAARVVMALARFFRISLSKGKSVISVKDEMEHVKNYLIIQKMRFKNRFEYKLEQGEDTQNLGTIKLVLQPLVENAIYHGMEYMDGDGEIIVKSWLECEGRQLCLSVKDNGPGMTKERVRELLSGNVMPSARGSGIGVTNVNKRIRLYFGEEYGLEIQSEPDEGTEMILRMPAISYEKMEEIT